MKKLTVIDFWEMSAFLREGRVRQFFYSVFCWNMPINRLLAKAHSVIFWGNEHVINLCGCTIYTLGESHV